MKCGAPLSPDEVGLTKKLVNRGATEYLCFACLGSHFRLSRETLDDFVRQFRERGCSLFPPPERAPEDVRGGSVPPGRTSSG